ncbi:hypothetical protein [Streptomyces sp. NPDC096013]|uniref:hypothetical protein n=1 Tax=Streptomyces sp. NPDC096013 TaxID=3366069 RepID=UPI00381C45FE
MLTPAYGAVGAETTSTYWVVYDDGSAGLIETTDEEAPLLSRPGRLVTQQEYQARLDELTAHTATHRAEQAAAEAQQARDDYTALIALGAPDATARRMSGYTGPASLEEGS